MTTDEHASVQIRGAAGPRDSEVLGPDALAFVQQLHERFELRRVELLAARTARQARLDAGELPDFLPETARIRSSDWQISPVPVGLRDRRVEITGPVDRKMVINALNSGARMFMADFEDANSPTWRNCIDGHINLADAIRGTISYSAPNGKEYQLGEAPATLLVRPRGWHLQEQHVHVLGEPVSASLFDFGIYVYHNAQALLDRGWGPWLYLPKLESHLEARLWNDVFSYAEDTLGLKRGTIRATVLIETLPAAFEMQEILYELRDHAAGLNAGRWDYIFSVIKKLRSHARFLLPDRADVTMTVPFMQAYSSLLVATCHRRGAHAMGGMAAFIPNRRDMEVTSRALHAVTADKQREARAGFDGTWVAHPDLVETAMTAFAEVLGDAPNQLAQRRSDIPLDAAGEPAHAAALLDTTIAGAGITLDGVRANVRVGLRYLTAWLAGSGAVAIDSLMEDAATAEISRSQLWQWIRHRATMVDGSPVTPQLVQELLDAEVAAQRTAADGNAAHTVNITDAAGILAQVVLDADFTEFITIPAYEVLMQREREEPPVARALVATGKEGVAP